MEYTKKEIMERLKKSHSWKEAQVGAPIDVYRAFEGVEGGCEGNYTGNTFGADTEALQARVRELESQVKELQDQKNRLSDTNKQLRAENKALRAGK